MTTQPGDLRAQRLRLGLTQARLAESLGVTANTLARWERGDAPIGNPELVRLALARLAGSPATASRSAHDAVLARRRIEASVRRTKLRPRKARGHNLPTSVSSFIGRSQELADVSQMLEVNRLVTLTGTGGVGKTRLALEVAAASIGRHSAGVWFVDLAGLANPDLVPQAVATSLGIPEQTRPRRTRDARQSPRSTGRPARIRQLRAPARRMLRSRRAAPSAVPSAVSPRDESRATRRVRRTRLAGAVSLAALFRWRHGRSSQGRACRIIRGGAAVRRPRSGRQTGLFALRQQRPIGRRHLRAPRRYPARARARGRTCQRAQRARDRGATRRSPGPALRWQPHCATTASHAARGARMELQPPHAERAAVLQSSLGVRGRVDARGRGSRVPASRMSPPLRSISWPPSSASRSC